MFKFGHDSFALKDIILCLIGMILCFMLIEYKNKIQQPDMFDSRQYIGAAYNLYHHGIKNDTASIINPSSSIGREPAYSWLLYMFFLLDDDWQKISPECLLNAGCEPSIYDNAVYLNFIFVALSGFIMYLFIFNITHMRIAAIIAGAHIWFNIILYKAFGQLISDPLALLITSLLIVTTYYMINYKNPILAFISGNLYVLLILTKAIFLYSLPIFIVMFTIYAIYCSYKDLIEKKLAIIIVSIFCLASTIPSYAWMERNYYVGDSLTITEGRTGTAIQAREIYNDMNMYEYAASFIYWITGAGDNISEALIEPKYWERFLLDNPDGFYVVGHYKFGEIMQYMKQKEPTLSYHDIRLKAIDSVKDKILSNPIKHIMVSIALLWRGIQIDFFIILSLPCLILLGMYLWRERGNINSYIFILVNSIPLYTIIIHPLATISIPRYFIPSIPLLSISLALSIGYAIYKKKLNRHKN